MAHFPLVLAIEPSLLPYARTNGFTMDHKVREAFLPSNSRFTCSFPKYRNFVFRKMFEKPTITFEGRADEIIRNVRELSRLDSRSVSKTTRLFRSDADLATCRMFLSRTVAAEICMEVKQNEPAYKALRRLDKEGLLRFDLACVVIHASSRQNVAYSLEIRTVVEDLIKVSDLVGRCHFTVTYDFADVLQDPFNYLHTHFPYSSATIYGLPVR